MDTLTFTRRNPKRRKRPTTFAEKHKLPIARTLEALVELVAKVHQRFPQPELVPPTAPALAEIAAPL